jgi:hypothetical protein
MFARDALLAPLSDLEFIKRLPPIAVCCCAAGTQSSRMYYNKQSSVHGKAVSWEQTPSCRGAPPGLSPRLTMI